MTTRARTRRWLGFAAILSTVLLAGCDDNPSANGEQTLRIGAPIALTGNLAVEGEEVRRGYELWVDWLNEEEGGILVDGERYLVDLILYDDESDPALSASLTERLIVEDEVDFLLGPYGSNATLTASAVADEHGVIMISSNGAAEAIFDRGFDGLFGVLTVAGQYTHSGLDALAAVGARTLFVASAENVAFSISAAQGAVDHAATLGLEVLATDTYTLQQADVTALIQAAADLAPDVFIAGSNYQDALLIRRTAEEMGFRPPAMLLTIGPSSPDFVEELGAAAEGVLGPTQWEPSMTWQGKYLGSPADYAARYTARYGGSPTYQAAQSTAAGLVLQAAIEAVNSVEPPSVLAALRATDLMTFYGPIRFDGRGVNTLKPMGLIQVQDGNRVMVAPPEMASAPLRYDDR